MNEEIWKTFEEYKDNPSDLLFEKLRALITIHNLLEQGDEKDER